MHPTVKAVCLFLIWLLASPFLSGAAETIVVRLDGERLTLHARNQPLTNILQHLADQAVRVRIDPQINPLITAAFDNRPIVPALASILKSVDYALIWRKDPSSMESEPRLREIRIFYKGQESRIQPLGAGLNLAIVKKDDGAYHVKDILLIRLSPDMTQAALDALLDRLGATLIDAYPPLGIVRLRLPYGSDVPAVAASVAGYPGVQTAEPDYAYPLGGGRPVRLEASSALQSSGNATTGAATVAVMDSGLLADYESSLFVQAAYDAVSPGAVINDQLGHGTQMTLIAAGAVNPLGSGADPPTGSPVVAIRAFDDNGFTSTYTLLRGIDFAIENNARVLSLSWGSETASALLESATRYAAEKGLILVAAAGNTPTGNPVYPAAYANVIGVGALTPDGAKWNQSNYGDFVAVSAPGVADLPVGYQGDPGTYAGTSIATAYTARRIAAILSQHPDADRETILNLLVEKK